MPTTSIIAAIVAQAAPPAATLPDWMAGCWIEQKAERWTEECWTAPRGGSMLGSGRHGRGATLGGWETMQVLSVNGSAPVFWGAPGGAGRTAFALVSRSAHEIVFANPAHDYPQRIRYWREGATLNAETSRIDGSKAMRWRYRRQG